MINYTKDDFANFNGKIIHCWPSHRGDNVVLVSIERFRSKRYVSIRNRYPKADRKFHLGKGITLPFKDRELLRALKRLVKLMEE